jgi:uncharacterized membrane protein YkvA (DUF1232 family)
VPAWLDVLVVAVLAVGAAWGVLYVLARRLPPVLLRDIGGFLPDCLLLLWSLRRHPEVPAPARAVAVLAVLWVLSPIDLVPGFIPVIGPMDDAVVMALAMRFLARRVPREVIEQSWPAEPRALALLIGNSSEQVRV